MFTRNIDLIVHLNREPHITALPRYTLPGKFRKRPFKREWHRAIRRWGKLALSSHTTPLRGYTT